MTQTTDSVMDLPLPPILAEVNAAWIRVMQSVSLMDECPSADAAIEQIMSMETLKARITDLAKTVEQARQEFGKTEFARWGREALFPYYVGPDRKVKCHNSTGLFQELLQTTDLETIESLMSSDPWKQGACKDVLGERWGEFFTVDTGEKLTESSGKKADAVKLQKASTFAR